MKSFTIFISLAVIAAAANQQASSIRGAINARINSMNANEAAAIARLASTKGGSSGSSQHGDTTPPSPFSHTPAPSVHPTASASLPPSPAATIACKSENGFTCTMSGGTCSCSCKKSNTMGECCYDEADVTYSSCETGNCNFVETPPVTKCKKIISVSGCLGDFSNQVSSCPA